MIADDKVTEIFCAVDEFCKYFTSELKKHQLPEPGRCHRNRKCILSDSEVMTILVSFFQTCALGKCTGEIKKRWYSYRVAAMKRESICDIPQKRFTFAAQG